MLSPKLPDIPVISTEYNKRIAGFEYPVVITFKHNDELIIATLTDSGVGFFINRDKKYIWRPLLHIPYPIIEFIGTYLRDHE